MAEKERTYNETEITEFGLDPHQELPVLSLGTPSKEGFQKLQQLKYYRVIVASTEMPLVPGLNTVIQIAHNRNRYLYRKRP